LQLAEHILFYKEFSKMSSSAFSILGPPGPGVAGVKPRPEPSWKGRDMCAKFH